LSAPESYPFPTLPDYLDELEAGPADGRP